MDRGRLEGTQMARVPKGRRNGGRMADRDNAAQRRRAFLAGHARIAFRPQEFPAQKGAGLRFGGAIMKMGSGQWAVGSEQWAVSSGQFRFLHHPLFTTHYPLFSEESFRSQ